LNRKIVPLVTIILILGLILFGCDNFSLIELLNNDISIIPEEITLSLGETVRFEVSSGIFPFTFTEIGGGSIPNGIYTAPGTEGSFTISVEDDRKRIAEADVTVVDAANMVNLVPEIITIGIGTNLQLNISGGIAPYVIDLNPGLGSDDHPGDGTLTFDYTSIAAGLETIRVTDNLGLFAEAYVTVSANNDLMISPAIAEVLTDGSIFFSASGGTSPYSFSVIGVGGINAGTGQYTAPSSSGTATVQVTDSNLPIPTTADATVYIVTELLTINPSIKITLYVGDQFTFSASHGNPPYSFSILGNEPSGSIESGTGLFTALIRDNNVTVVVTDVTGNTSTCRVQVKN